PAVDVVVVHLLVQGPQLPPGDGRNLLVVVFAGAVKRCHEGHIVVAQVVLGRVLEAFEQAVVGVAVEVEALVPGHFAALGQHPDAELGVGLVAATFLALAGVVEDVVREAAVAPAVHVVAQGVFVQRPVVAKNADGHDRFD
nr:hypothetical protein [Tanacetum cinerariifolium]